MMEHLNESFPETIYSKIVYNHIIHSIFKHRILVNFIDTYNFFGFKLFWSFLKNEEKNLFDPVSTPTSQIILRNQQKLLKQKMSIIIPTYNERGGLNSLVNKIDEIIQRYNFRAEIILIDDNSPDGTGKLADILSKTKKNIKVIHRPKKLGLGSAYKTAIKNATGDLIITMDADFSHNPEEIPKLLATLRNHKVDIVIGSRYIQNNLINGWSLRRRLISRIGNLLARYVLDLEIRDLTSDFRIYKYATITRILNEINTDRFFFQVEAV